jgi:hypothetical protein
VTQIFQFAGKSRNYMKYIPIYHRNPMDADSFWKAAFHFDALLESNLPLKSGRLAPAFLQL